MSLVKFEIFSKIAEVGSFTKAADSLQLTQSAVSHAITSLEKEFELTLINRNKTGVTLTNAGEHLLFTIRKVLHYNEKVYQEAASLNGLSKGTIKIGIFTSVSMKWLPDIIKIMEAKYPAIHIELREGDYFEIEQWLLSGEIDCGFVNITQSNQFDIIPLKNDPLLCIVSNQSELYNKPVVTFEDLEKVDFIMPSYGGSHDVKRLFEAYNVQPNIRFELMEETAIMSMISHHLGISILPELVLDSIPKQLRAIPLEVNSYRSIGLATRYNLSPAGQKFAEVTKDWLSGKEQ
ncbi:LysR family transcriptional regulator [Priestia endophytica]|jgi:DNA-binding transcriptional LysR family regulator|uniref:LysR family transcriptional regulator n=1 Tax=Priestia endophytica TaxID=135735 RepID=A0AAX1QBZ8_9BACI|nr:LysR family transcriptional regulator [Priestia endophytica]KAB2492896.1 LysR family transcriptional regulator [Priestia endophytica]MCM3538428.1 LysR family transcriptional regulator [Priestia endophytica]RAS80508.1 LysR family transcriptional regulator [Priestia endophytica]RAS85893.1 LysR family transcriptional regulator [Priestia endophytica]